MIRYTTTMSQRGIDKFIQLMRDHNLYNYNSPFSGFWQLAHMGKYRENVIRMSMAYDVETPIGVGITFSPAMYGCATTCFVRKQYRHNGIGSILVTKITTKKIIESGAHQFPIGFPKYVRNTSRVAE